MGKSKFFRPLVDLSKNKTRLAIFALWIFVILCDQLTKAWALAHIPQMNHSLYPYGGWALGQLAGIQAAFVLTFNTGAAWNLLEHSTQLLWAIRSTLIMGLAVYVLYTPHPRQRWPLACMVAGALSNWIDQALHGYVIDMVSVTFWGYMYPIFNLADSVICLAAIAFFFMTNAHRHRQ